MAGQVGTTANVQVAADERQARIQRRHHIAAIVYFLYGLFYLFGAQYVTASGMSSRGTSGSAPLFFAIGGVIAVLFPILIYRIFAFGIPLGWIEQMKGRKLYISFTLLLGLAVIARVVSLVRLEFYAKSPLHVAGLIIVTINAACLLWAGLSKPAWLYKKPEGSA